MFCYNNNKIDFWNTINIESNTLDSKSCLS